MHVEPVVRAGMLPISTVGEPGTHGAAVTGVHGIGVNTPSAAAVAAATAGFAMLIHMPNGAMFTNGLLSMMFAAGGPDAVTRFTGSTVNTLGATPKVHVSAAPDVTCNPIVDSFSRAYRLEGSDLGPSRSFAQKGNTGCPFS